MREREREDASQLCLRGGQHPYKEWICTSGIRFQNIAQVRVVVESQQAFPLTRKTAFWFSDTLPLTWAQNANIATEHNFQFIAWQENERYAVWLTPTPGKFVKHTRMCSVHQWRTLLGRCWSLNNISNALLAHKNQSIINTGIKCFKNFCSSIRSNLTYTIVECRK